MNKVHLLLQVLHTQDKPHNRTDYVFAVVSQLAEVVLIDEELLKLAHDARHNHDCQFAR